MKNLKLFSVILMLLVGIGQMWADDVINNAATSSALGSTGTTSWKSPDPTIVGASGAEYTIHSMGTSGTTNAIQWNKNGFLYQTKSGGTLKSVTIKGAAKKINIFASNTAYSAKATGTQLAQVTASTSGVTYTFESDYTYLAINGTESSTSITEITVAYQSGGGGDPSVSLSPSSLDLDAENVANQSVTITASNFASAISSVTTGLYSDAECTSEITSGAWVKNVIVNGEKTAVTFDVDDNNTGVARECWLKVSASDGTGNASAAVHVAQKKIVVDYATLPFSFTGGRADIETTDGMTQSGIGTDYGDANAKLKFDHQGDWLIVKFNSAPGKVTYNIKNNTFSGGTFTVQESADGEIYTDVVNHTAITGTQNEEHNLAQTSRYVKFIYTTKASGNVGIGNIAISLPVDVSKVATPEISGTANFYPSTSVSITCGTENAAIYYTTDGTTPTSASTPYEGAFTVNADGTTTVKAIAVKDGMTDSDVAEQTFTKITPISVATALENIDALSNNGTIPNQYVKGLISEIVQYNSGNTITYYISDDGSTTSQLQVYKGSAGVANGGNPFTSETDLKEGEEVVVFGTLKKFKSGSNPVVPEFVNPNEIVAYKPHSPLAWSANAYTAELTGENTFPALSGTAGLTITYSSSDATKASFADASVYEITLNAVTGEDPVTITASSAATDDYVATSVSYALTIQESVVRYTLDYVCNEATSGCPETTHLTDQTNVPSPLPTVAKDGKNFGGWYLESTFENLATAGDPLTGNTTLYAQWLEPYTVAQALTMIDALADNGTTGNVYVAGVVTDDEVEVASNVATYYIKDAGESNSLMVYKGNGLGNTSVSEGDILESDQVVVYGALKKYVKNTTTTPEIVNPNYIYSRVRPTTEVTGVTLPATAIVRVGSTITLTPTIAPNNATNKNVSWSVISGNTYAEVSDAGVVTGLIADGDAVIQVETEDGGFTATCTVSVAAARPTFTEDDHEWIKVTNASKLIAGRYYVIASETKGKTAKNTISSNRLDQVASTFEDGRISVTNLGTNTAIFELGGVSEAWTLNEVTNEANTGLLSYNADKKVEWAGTNTTWDISIENGNATIAAVSASTERILHNNSSSWFTVYASATSSSMLLPQLYMWAELSHAVTFDANGGVPGSVPGIERTDEGKIIIPATEPTHSDVAKAFAGWYKDGAPSTLYNAGDEFATNEDVTLYAKWNTVPTYTVSYSANGGTGAAPAEPVTVKAGTTITVVENTGYTNPGKTFDGWLVTYNNGTEQTINLDENSQFSMPAYNVVIKATWAEESNQKWALVTAASQLVAGAKYIIAAAGYDYAMAGQKTNNRDATAVVKKNEGAQLKGTASMQVITLEGTTGAWEFNTSAGYLYAAASGSNHLKTQETNDINGKWTITISEGVASIVASGSSNRNVMQFNNGSSKLFSCYSSASEKAVALYKEIPMTEITTNDMDQDDVPDGGDMTIKEDKTWTVSSAKEVGDVYMEEGAVIANSAAVTANDLYFKTKAGKSNQIHEASQLNVIGDLYYDVQLCSGSLDADYWYIIAVPFDVNINDGISLADGTPMINGVDYEVWIYDTQKRAQTTNGWKRANGKMEAGKAYFIGFNPGMPNTVRLKAAPGWKDHLFSGSSLALTKTAEEAPAGVHDNWNGIANPKMRYVGIDKENVQMYSNETHTFSAYTGTAYDFVVGTAFFVKSTGNVTIADGSHLQFLAPKRDAERKLGYEVRITPAEAAEFDNQIIVRASESANGEYNSNRDMLTLNEATSKSAALFWTENYGDKRLAIEEAPLVNSSASYVLGIYAPADGEYTISTPQAKEDVSLYLTRNGRVIWDLTAAPYTLDLTKGNTTGYGLRIVAAPKATTDLEDVQSDKVQCTKVLINNHVFILRGEQLYDATGRLVK